MNWQKQFGLFVAPGILLATVLTLMFFLVRVSGLFVESVWFDKIMHVLGGAGACILTLLIVVNLPPRWMSAILRHDFQFIGRMVALFFGIGWEILEAIFPVITDHLPQGQWDTGFDLVFDYLGGHIAGRVYESRRKSAFFFALTAIFMYGIHSPPLWARRGVACCYVKTK